MPLYFGVLAAFQAKELGILKVRINTDSQYVMNSITMWLASWKAKGTADSKRKNIDLLLELESKLTGFVDVKWQHVRGHTGIFGNEEADRLANAGAVKE